ncbi:MAG: hypothetical protein QOF76_5618 [Solirubrobacteraceae bacterium]|jgi:hypothetical protein|nr:hypothetical protein [Solirubrobacteraceae bacterium]
MTGQTPLFNECVVGYRYWSVVRDTLEPISVGPAWRPGVNTAICHAKTTTAERHAAPASGCDCGLYARHAIPPPPHQAWAPGKTYVLGAVAAWGNLEVHRSGLRAEHAQILALASPWPGARPPSLRLSRDTKIVAASFDQGAAFLAERDIQPEEVNAPRILTAAGRSPLGLRMHADQCILLPGWDADARFADEVRTAMAEDLSAPEQCMTPATMSDWLPSLQRAATRYGLPVVRPEELAGFAARFGSPLPASVIPARELSIVEEFYRERGQTP